MLKIIYSPGFISQFERLNVRTRNHALKKIDLFIEDQRHPSLRVHKLNGQLAGLFAFSIDYTMRVIFSNVEKGTVRFLRIGDHSVYR